jgi:integrase
MKKLNRYVYQMIFLDKDKAVYNIAYIDEDRIKHPHPITDFLRKYRSSSFSLERERQVASCVCQFLNYVREMTLQRHTDYISLINSGMNGLNFTHGSYFLKYQDSQVNKRQKRVRRETVDRKENILTALYVFFQEQGVIDKGLLIHTYLDEKGKLKYASPFNRTRKGSRSEPPVKDLRDFGENRLQLLLEFIETARSFAAGKRIAFGLTLQALGGIRRGEIVNCTTRSINEKGINLNVSIEDRQDHLFKGKKNTTKEQVKKPRPQDIIPGEYVINRWKEHRELLEKQQAKMKFKVTDALFVNQNGSPMSGNSYQKIFNQVVRRFLNRINSAKRFNEYSFLTAKPFNTHTLRGVFTNICLDNLGMSIQETAIFRGDSDDSTVKEYLEELTGRQKMNKAVEQLAQAVIDANACEKLKEKWSLH